MSQMGAKWGAKWGQNDLRTSHDQSFDRPDRHRPDDRQADVILSEAFDGVSERVRNHFAVIAFLLDNGSSSNGSTAPHANVLISLREMLS